MPHAEEYRKLSADQLAELFYQLGSKRIGGEKLRLLSLTACLWSFRYDQLGEPQDAFEKARQRLVEHDDTAGRALINAALQLSGVLISLAGAPIPICQFESPDAQFCGSPTTAKGECTQPRNHLGS